MKPSLKINKINTQINNVKGGYCIEASKYLSLSGLNFHEEDAGTDGSKIQLPYQKSDLETNLAACTAV